MYAWAVMWRPGRHRLSYPQAWPEDRRHGQRSARDRLRCACACACTPEAIRRSLSRDVSPQATPVDNLDDACLAATLQPMHALTPLVLSPKCD